MKVSVNEMRGLLKGLCLPADIRFGEYLPEYLVRKFDELQQKLDEIAAENASLKSKLMFWDAEDPEAPYDCPEDIANNCCIDVGVEFDVKVAARMPDRTYRVSSADDYSCSLEIVSAGIPETPATDAYLDSVRANGVQEYANDLRTAAIAAKENGHDLTYDYLSSESDRAEKYAQRLRSGTHDTADKAG